MHISNADTAEASRRPAGDKKKPAAAYFPPVWSIIGVRVLDFRVRNGNGYCHPTMATGIKCQTIRVEGKPASPAGRKIWPGLTTY